MRRKNGKGIYIISGLFVSAISSASCLLSPRCRIRRSQGRSAPAAAAASVLGPAHQAAQLSLSRYRVPYQSDFYEGDGIGRGYDQREPAMATERPVLTSTARDPIPTKDPVNRQKIVVLGASGKIGRLVIRHFMESSVDATIVAFCRDYDKACRVLSDELIAVQVTADRAQSKHEGPSLKIVEGEIAPPGTSQQHVQDILQVFYNESSASSDLSELERSRTNDRIMNNPLLTLAEAIQGASVVISCVGAVRDTHLWTDWIARPFWRIMRPNVTGWCTDQRHPYYAHYLTTKVALQLAEGEEKARLRRQHEQDEAQRTQDSVRFSGNPPAVSRSGPATRSHQKRMRFIRISDLCVSQRPWQFVPFMTNLLHSMVLRYQDMAEKILQQSSVVETIVLRPGDLVSEHDRHAADQYDYGRDDAGERDSSTTSVQVGVDGWLPEPSRIGRDDVAALAVAAALFDPKDQGTGDRMNNLSRKRPRSTPITQSSRFADVERSHIADLDAVFHYTLACRWVGDQLHPYPPQGQMIDGLTDARTAMQQALTTLTQTVIYRRDEAQLSPEERTLNTQMVPPKIRRRRSKPYGLIVSIPTYTMLYMIASRFVSLMFTIVFDYWGVSHPPVPSALPTLSRWLCWCWRALIAAVQTVAKVSLRCKAVSHQYIPV